MLEKSMETLKQELKNRGCNAAQITSKSIPLVVEILAQNPGLYDEFVNYKPRLSELKKEIYDLIEKANRLRMEVKALQDKSESLRSHIDANEIYRKYQCNIDAFYKALTDAETPEGKDALRKAQLFAQSVNIETEYDNYAYITGLGNILSSSPCIAPIERIVKIPDEIPKQRKRI